MVYPSRVGWRFRNVSQGEDFLPTLDSIEIDDTNQQDVATMSFAVVDEDLSITIEEEDEVWASVGGVKVFAGRIKTLDVTYRSEVGPRVYECEAQDFTARLDDSVIDHSKSRPAEDVADRVAWILSFLNFSITTAGVNLPTFACDAGDFDGATVREALDQTADEARLSYYVDFDKDLHMFRTETVTAPFDLDNDAPDYSASFPFSEWHHARDSVELGNATLVIGDKRRAWVEDSASIAQWGRQERSLQDSELVTTAAIQNAGARANAENGQPQVDGGLVCREPGLQAGMTFHLTPAEWQTAPNDVSGTYIVTELSITAVDPHDDLGEAYAHYEVTYSDRRRARPYRHPRSPKSEAPLADGSSLTKVRGCMSANRDRIQAYGGGTPAPLADSVAYGTPVPPAHATVTDAAPSYRRSYLASDCGPGFQAGHTGFLREEQYVKVTVGSLSGVGAVRVTYTTSDLNHVDGKDLIYGVRSPDPTVVPDDCEQYVELGRCDVNGGSFDIPAGLLVASSDNYIVIAPGWKALRGVSCCDGDLLNGFEGPLGGLSPGGGEYNSGQVTIAIASVKERVLGDDGGLVPWTSPDGDVDGSNTVYSLPFWTGKGVPEVRIGIAVLASGSDYTYDDEAGTVTLSSAPWPGAPLEMRWRV